MKKWSSQWTQFMQLRKEAWKKLMNNNKGAVFLEKLTEVFVSEESSLPFKSQKWPTSVFLEQFSQYTM